MNVIKFIAVLCVIVLATSSYAFADIISAQKHFNKNEYALARADWQKAADQGDAKAMDKLADMYANGTGVAVDYAKALQYWHRAAEAGDGAAMFEIGVSYQYARGVPLDVRAADDWLHKALDACDEHAALRIIVRAEAPPADTDKALACLKQSAQEGDYKAMMDLAGKNRSGEFLTKNPLEATSWGHVAVDTMQKKADAGDTQAMYYMGRAFFGGVGNSILRDSQRGLKLCEKAAALGDIDAGNWLVSTYLSDDKYKDDKKVRYWNKKLIAQYTVRAEKGDVSSMVRLAAKYYTPPAEAGSDMGQPVAGTERDVSKALHWAQKAATLGSRDAQFLLGRIYEDKTTGRQDCKKAHDFYDKAAASGDLNASARLGARVKGVTVMDCSF